ncbi:MAG: HAMP domain-containing histidine kinase, partial [Armatimonadetes bacterium]|nr:HAMP domain-containing histidine kinase [Armatimonadota bacterium]
MRSLRWRLTITHLLVSLLAVALVALLTPPLFFRTYTRSELKRWHAITGGLARAAEPLLREGADSPHLLHLIRTSAQVLAAEVTIIGTDGRVVISSNPDRPAGQLLPRTPAAPSRLTEHRTQLAGGWIVIRKPVPGWEQLLRAQRDVVGFAALAAAVLAVLLAYASARAVAAPLVTMSEAAHRLAEGDFAVSLPETGPAEVRSLAASMNHMAESLASLDGLRREFIASASHELRAPLSSIRGFLGALQDGTADSEEERQRCLAAAAAEARRMTRLVEDLLQLSRLQAGVLEFEFEPTNLREVVEGVVHSFEPRLREHDVQAKLNTEDVPVVMADGERLVQVVVNLLDNALRYSPAGGTIAVTVGRGLVPRPDRVVVTVADEGPGIPESDLAEVFERFHKADPARQVGDQGAGLGLAIAKEIVARHGGEVFARNRE